MQISEGLAVLVGVIYIVLGAGWAAYWWRHRADHLHWRFGDWVQVRRGARMALLTPVWPVVALFYLIRAVKELVEDAL